MALFFMFRRMQNRIIETRYYIDSREGKELSTEIMKKYRVNAAAYLVGFKSALIYLKQKETILYADCLKS